MPRQKKGPTDEEWGLQKSRIKEIFDRKGNDGDKVTVAKLREIMKRGHSFDAPLWQYEAKLKEWNLKRNGRLEDWAVVISKVDQLGEGGMIVRVLMSGHAVEKKIINRNRRLVNKLKAAGKQLCPFDEWRADPRTDYISIEVQNQADEWVSYTGDQCLEEVTRPLVAPRSGLATFDSRDIAPSLNVETNIGSPISLRFNPPQLSPSMVFGDAVLPMLPQIPDSPFSQLIQYPPDTSAGPWSHQNDVTFAQSSTQQSVVRYQPAPRIEIPATPVHISYQFNPVTSDETQQPAQSNGFGIIQFIPRPVSPWSDSLRRLIQSVLRDGLASQTSVARVVKIPQVEDVLDGLESQISLARDVSRTISTTDIGAEINSKLQHSIYLSIINGFASFPMPSVTTGFLLAKTQHTVSEQLFEHLRTRPLAMAKHLAYNLFRAAVETGDAQSLTYIIDVMRSRGITINPEDIYCHHELEDGGMPYTCTLVKLATRLENAEVLNILTTDLKFDLSRVHPFMTNPSIAFTLLPTGAQVDLKGAAIIVQRFGRVDESVVREMLRQLRDIRCQPNGCAQASCGSQNLLWTILNCCEVTFAVASIRHLLENCCVGWAATLIESLIEAPEEAGPPLCNFATTTVLHILDGCERSRASVMSLSRLADVLAEFLRSLSGRDRALSYEFAMTAIDRFIEDCKTYGYPDGFPISILISLVHIPTDAALRANDPICNFAMSTVGRLVERYNSLEKPNYQIRSPEEALAECLCVAASRADVLVCKFLLNLIPVSHHALITAARANSNNPIIDLFLNDKSICEALQKAPSICCTCHNYWQSLRRPGDPSGCKISTRTALGDAVRRRDLDLVARLEKAGAWRLVQDNCKAFKDLFSAAIETVASDFLSRLLKIWNDRLPGWSHSQLDDILHIVYLSIEKDMTDIALSLLDTAIQRKDFRSFTWNGFGHSYKRGGILFHLALARRNERIVEVLLESDMGFLKPDLTLPTWCRFEGMQESALLLANRWKGHPFVQELIHLGCALYGALEQAVKAEELELVRFLLRWNWDPKELGTSFLHALMKHNKELVQLLMAAGADPANVDAFRFAIGAGCKISEGLSSMSADSKIFQILVDKDADWEALGILIHAFKTRYPNGRSGFGADALIIVLTGNDINLLRRLLQDARLDVNSYASNYSNYMKSNYSFSPLGFAIRHCREIGLELEQVEMLLQAGADINAVAEGLYLDNRKMDKPPETALQVVIRTRDLQMVEFLVHRGAKVNHPARRGLKMTPLQTACSIGSYPIAEFLLNQGAEVNAPPAYSAGATALQFAAISGSTRIVELLLQRGADIHAAPSKYNGRTALQGAAEHGRMHVLNILWERGNGRFPDEEIRMAQEFARKNRNPACAEHLDWLSEVSPAERRLQIGDLAHMAVPETETWEGEGLR